ncbi:MAG TPA: hypothetical protein VFZ00_27125 [Solirubrobacter sp.]|jgi:hypothetical protein|nr:hypothetical protein [Solirubrobacter sp.]
MSRASRRHSEPAALVGAAVTGLIAFTLFVAGALLLWANGHYKDRDGYISTGSESFESDGYAITSDKLEVGAGPGWLIGSERYGTIRLTAAQHGGKPLFVGIARTRDVDSYLRSTARSEVANIEFAPFSVSYANRGGSRAPGPPAAQDIWVAQGSRRLTWKVQSGDWSVVVMNADGSRGVAAGISAGATVPYLSTLGYVALGLGVAFIVATALLTLHGTRPPARMLVAA